MAIMNKIVLAASALAAVALAAPLDARAMVTNVVTETAWTTMDVVATVWVDENGKILTTEDAVFAQVTPTPLAVVVPSSSVEPTVKPSIEVPSVKSSPPTTFSTATTPALAVIPVPTTPAAPSPVSTTTTPAPVVAPIPTTSAAPSPPSTTASWTAPAVSSASVNAAQVDSGARDLSASASNTCEGTGAACVGDVTHWDGGLGACGWGVDTDAEMAVALPAGFMGSQSNGNPYCGRSITLVNPTSGTTVQAVVGDKCMGCVDRALDCTNKLFNAITDGKGDGRLSGIQWYLN